MALKLMAYFGNIALLILTINLVIFIKNYKTLPSVIKVLGIFFVVNFITEVIARGLFYQKIPNLFLLHIYTILEFLSWSIFYKYLFEKKEWFPKKLLDVYFDNFFITNFKYYFF